MSVIIQSKFPLAIRTCSRLHYSIARFSSETSKNVESAEEKQQKVYEKPLYATKRDFEAQIRTNRESRTLDQSSGYRPSGFQRWMLVITGLYSSRSKIPEYVSNHTMQRLHDRNRVVFIVVATVLFFVLFLTMEYRTGRKIEKDRAAGKVVTKMA